MEDNRDLKISGSGSMSGGKFNQVHVSGSGKIVGDVECNEIHISGSSKIEGNVKAREYRISGSCKVTGNLEGESIKISGAAHILGNLKVQEAAISGGTKIDGTVSGEEIKVSGNINIGKDCEVERFKSNGAFDIGGLLNAENIEIGIAGKCTVREIGGENISIKDAEDFGFSLFNLFVKKKLFAEVIEGDNIELENTVAKVVRGKNVIIGEGCEIESVEYSESIKIDSNSKVNLQKKI